VAADNLAFPWAREFDADQLAAFIEDLWGAASGDNDFATLDAIEEAIAQHRPAAKICPLSRRELSILTELASGETKESAARNLGLSAETVRARCQQIYARLDAKNVTQAAVIAMRNGWLTGVREPALPPPVPVPLSRSWRRVHQKCAAELRKKPGQTLPIGPYMSHNGARTAASCIRRGEYQDFGPAGSFTAEVVRSHRHWIVLACYVGDSTAPTSTNCAEREAS
jgi:DNA-binding CsgD family transcriptional regulator